MHQRFATELHSMRMPRPPQPGITPEAFMICPIAMLAGQSQEQRMWQQWLYQQAFEQAQAVARPSLLERDLLGVWN
jgi:hypothetical protein